MKKYLFLFILLGLLAPSLAAQEFTEGIFTYRVLTDDQGNPTTNVAVVGINEDCTDALVIPEKVSDGTEQYTVTSLESSNRYMHVSSLHIPSSIIDITGPFMEFLRMDEIISDSEAFDVLDGVLYNADHSELVKCPYNIEVLTTPAETKLIRYGAACTTNIKVLNLNEGLETIDDNAFNGCSSLEKVNLPSSLRTIGAWAFSYCPLLSQQIVLGDNVTSINHDSFAETPITGFSVSTGNATYATFNGNLYSKDYSTLLRVAGGNAVLSFPNELTTIGEAAFSFCSFDEIIIPEGVTTVGPSAFWNCAVTKVVLPNTVTLLDDGAFHSCTKLKDLVIPSSVVEIGQIAFCDIRMESIVIPATVKKVSATAFIYNSPETKVIFMGNDVEIDVFSSIEPTESSFATLYAAGNTYSNLYWAFNSNDEIVKPLPETLLNGWAVDLGANSTYNISLGLSNCGAPASGLQFDITFPQGVTPEQLEISDNTSNCKSEWTKLANGDYRVLAYTANAQPFANRHVNFGMVLKSDETIGRSEALFHDIKFSMEGASYSLPDETMYIAGYDINVPDLGEIEEGDVVGLPDPLSVQYEDVTYRWISSAETVAKIVDNSALQTLSPGTFQLQVQVSDPQGYVPIAYRTVTVTPALWGDADRSKAIDLADVVAVVNHILEREVENFSAKLADVNRDGSIDVADLTSIVKLVLAQPVPDEGEGDVTAAPGLRELSFGEAQLGADGKRHISLEIETTSDYTAMQTDIELPDGYTVEAVSLGSELGKHALDYAAVAPQTTRLILYSASLAELPAGRKAAVVDLTLSGAGEGSIRASRALACDADGRSYTLAATEAPLNVTTGVSSAEGAGMSATAVAGGMEITAPEGTHVTVSDIAGRVLLSFTTDAAPAFRPFAPGVYVVAFEGSAATAKVLVK